ncbi:hypothetical protein CY34DRAFT_311532 [Suillus luteus UH-Slu-Lm8-n1]|uniref:Uncharacterized protein n=1 Tax=Suillus luteus UH-Slu-Lm8-n1 TaxID=930992 RepID=A0A0D0C341_9AGAM|nr:hypothetical protein CY34DRAFT_311532 [Suillus luteus UH-Slu-Lm8-n1]
MLVCHGAIKTGCWQRTSLESSANESVLFDRSIAAKLPEGSMEVQDLVAWSEMKPSGCLTRGSASRVSRAI